MQSLFGSHKFDAYGDAGTFTDFDDGAAAAGWFFGGVPADWCGPAADHPPFFVAEPYDFVQVVEFL